MRRIRYSKYVPDPAGEMSMEDLLGALSDYLLQSGFHDYLSYYDLPRTCVEPSNKRCSIVTC
jgi:Ca-activated chloride channel family protein